MKVEVDFPVDYVSKEVLPLPLGRIYFGSFLGRLVLTPTGEVKMAIDRRAVELGYIVLVDPHTESFLTGSKDANSSSP